MNRWFFARRRGRLDAWEEALYLQKFGFTPSARDAGGDGMNVLQEFQLGFHPVMKDIIRWWGW